MSGRPTGEAKSLRAAAEDAVRQDLERGSVFYDLHTSVPYHLDVFAAAIKNGRGNELHRRLFVVHTMIDGTATVRQPTIFLDLSVAPKTAAVPVVTLVDRAVREQKLVEEALTPFLAETAQQAAKQTKTIRDHLQISLDELIHRQNMTLGKQNVTLFVIDTYGEVYIGWAMQQLDALGLPSTMAVEYAKAVAALIPGVTPDPKHVDSLSRELTAEEVGRALDRFTYTVSRFVE